ncbi:YggS family pyridoxal phosphate-dependent enzyme [Deltaproteobacteria bacterium Smac51]|nr:YggS family pyridoxal phosphate-dependent enzyme [Deltaproteobacteria bacterium Smac51]
MGRAAERSGRDFGEITLLGVSKTFPADRVRTYLQIGLTDFGESYIQEAREKAAELESACPAPHWHFIGHLQTNKAKYAAALFDTIHSVDSYELAHELNRRAAALSRVINIYAQVNVSGEGTKSGMAPSALPEFLKSLPGLTSLKLLGLMTMPPYDPDPETARPHFQALRRLRDEHVPGAGLSMGMSGDFEVAIEEGSTIIRVGTALFGDRT